MRVISESLISGAKEARGVAVVIDVFRAATTAAFIIDGGAGRILPVSRVEEALRLKEENPDYVLVGEDGGGRVEDFDYGNSPSEMEDADLGGKTVVLRTSAGTQGLVHATGAEELFFGSFVTAGAIVDYIRNLNPETVTLVAMGREGVERSVEDELCAEYLKKGLQNQDVNFEEMVESIRNSESGRKFSDEEVKDHPLKDMEYALDLDRFGFLPRCDRSEKGLEIRKAKP